MLTKTHPETIPVDHGETNDVLKKHVKKELLFIKVSLESLLDKFEKQGAFLELDQKPAVGRRLLRKLKMLRKKAEKLQNNFKLENVHAKKVNCYFTILGTFDVLIQHVDNIYKRKFNKLAKLVNNIAGSKYMAPINTQETITKIRESYDAVNDLLTYYE